MTRTIVIGCLLPALVCAASAAAERPAFLTQHCTECHDKDTKKGNLDLSALKPDFTDGENFARWVKVHDRIAAGEMPPEKKPQPAAAERGKFLSALRESLHAASLAEPQACLGPRNAPNLSCNHEP